VTGRLMDGEQPAERIPAQQMRSDHLVDEQ